MKAVVGSTYTPKYVMTISQAVIDKDMTELPFGMIQQLIQEQAISDQRMREIETGRKWRDYEKRRGDPIFMRQATKKTVRAMILWKLLESRGGGVSVYSPTQDLVELGRLAKYSNSKAIPTLYGYTLRGGRQACLSPTEDLIPLRDSEVPAEQVAPYPGMTRSEALSITNEMVKKVLGRGLFDVDVLASWGKFFGLLNVFDPSLIGGEAPRQMYLTSWLVTLAELTGGTLPSTADANRTAILIKIGESKWRHESPAYLHNALLRGEVTAVSEDPSTCGTLTDTLNLIPEKVVIIGTRKSADQEFEAVLRSSYEYLVSRSTSSYVWITALRALVCRILKVSNESFDSSLRSFYERNPDVIEFSTAAASLSRKIRRFEEALNLYGQKYRMVRLES